METEKNKKQKKTIKLLVLKHSDESIFNSF